MPHELILGGARSGKSRRAELCARAWLAQSAQHQALLLATAWAGDAEMAARIARHQADRAERVPALATLAVPRGLPQALAAHSAPQRLLVVDCLTLWLSQCLMPPPGEPPQDLAAEHAALLGALAAAPGPVVLVSNEIGQGVMPLQRAVREVVDALGALHQAVAALCPRVTLMVAGLPLTVKNEETAPW
ncbi:bifunctional adenosylcobinamide kinase/adenosylcobinamide-phosphate guanylyltransferase [Aquabacterium sp. OR-4]|nr:bifunctional adenosylcobinamide kinase/adenosylcobinamide-phosphate guanylyltransferase [Aquabacterium sp. OR-4]MDT7836131.1 bifunctional adenosylcobinamide kinase/adenosylcobinamide-phosphate guanylyltransferase [Aquabacterium sp. OR-4]